MPVEELNCPCCGAPLEPVQGLTSCPYCSSAIHIYLNSDAKTSIISLFATKAGDNRAAALDPASKPLSEAEARDLAGRIGSLYGEGQRAAAVKLYRGRTGEGVLDSKKAVERLAVDPSLSDLIERLRSGIKPDESKKLLTAEYIQEYVRSVVEQGNKLDAVQWYANMMGVSPIEAKRAVEAIMGQESFY